MVPVLVLGTVPVSGVMRYLWYRNGLEHTFEIHQEYIRYILYARCWLTKKSRILADCHVFSCSMLIIEEYNKCEYHETVLFLISSGKFVEHKLRDGLVVANFLLGFPASP